MELLAAIWDGMVGSIKEYAWDVVETTGNYIFGKTEPEINPDTTFSHGNVYNNCTVAEDFKFKFKQCCYISYDFKALNSDCYEGQEYKFNMSICYYRGGLIGAKKEPLSVYAPFTADEGYRLLQNTLGKCTSRSSETHESSSHSFQGAFDLENYTFEVELSSKDGSLLPKTLADDFYSIAKGMYKPIIEQFTGEEYVLLRAKLFLYTVTTVIGGAIGITLFWGAFCYCCHILSDENPKVRYHYKRDMFGRYVLDYKETTYITREYY